MPSGGQNRCGGDIGTDSFAEATAGSPEDANLSAERQIETDTRIASLDERLAAASVRVDSDLLELLPAYIADRNADLQVIDVSLGDSDFRRIWRVGHSMMGTASAYGFDRLNELGRDLRDSAQGFDRAGVVRASRLLRDYLVEVEPLVADLVAR